MRKSDSIANLAAALAQAQPKFRTAVFDKQNPHFRSKYASLGAVWEAIRAPLAEHGLSVVQIPDIWEDKPALTSVLVHASGEWIAGTFPLQPVKNDPQGFGSAMTYARRYGLAALLGIVSDEDDDGNEASASSSKQPASAAKPASPPAAKASGSGAPSSTQAELEQKLGGKTLQTLPQFDPNHNEHKTVVKDILKAMGYPAKDFMPHYGPWSQKAVADGITLDELSAHLENYLRGTGWRGKQ